MFEFPFTSVKDHSGEPVAILPTDTGWQLDAPSGLQAQVRALRDAVICRLAPAADGDVVQFGIGNATSLLCNALYSPAQDLAYGFAAPGLRLHRAGRAGFVVNTTGPLTVTVEERLLESGRGLTGHRPPARSTFERMPAGWATGPAYGADVTEADIHTTADWLARHLAPFGLEWLYVDEGWQARELHDRLPGDSLQASATRFSGGMQALAAAIRQRGLRPALWATPFLQPQPGTSSGWSRLWLRAAKPLPDEAPETRPNIGPPADIPFATWDGSRVVDATFPDAGAHFRRFTRLLLDDWGYNCVTLGKLDAVLEIYAQDRAALHDPNLTPEEALRRGLHLMRVAAGQTQAFHTDAPVLPASGLVQTVRTVAEPVAGSSDPRRAADATLANVFLNTFAFNTEPGALRAGEDIPLEQARLWASFLAVSGQAVRLGDRVTDLTPERVELLRRILPIANIHPMDLYPPPHGARPRVLDLKIQHQWIGEWDVVALCNWDAEPAEIALTSERLGLAPGRFVCLDAWTGELVHCGAGLPTVTVPRESCRVITCWAEQDRPQFVGSSRHLTQGALDVESVFWEERRFVLRGESTLVRGDPYTVRVYVPPTYRIAAPEVIQRGPIAEIRLDRPYGGRAGWWLRFERM